MQFLPVALTTFLALTSASPLTERATIPIAANITFWSGGGCTGFKAAVPVPVPSDGKCIQTHGTPGIPSNFFYDSYKINSTDLLAGCNVTSWTDTKCTSANRITVGAKLPQLPGSCEQNGPEVRSFSASCPRV